MSLYQVDRAPLRGPLSRRPKVQESPPGRSGSPGPAAGAAQPWPRCSPAASLAAVALRRRPLARRRRRRAVCLPGPPVAGCGGSSRRSAALLGRRARAVWRRSALGYRQPGAALRAGIRARSLPPARPRKIRGGRGLAGHIRGRGMLCAAAHRGERSARGGRCTSPLSIRIMNGNGRRPGGAAAQSP